MKNLGFWGRKTQETAGFFIFSKSLSFGGDLEKTNYCSFERKLETTCQSNPFHPFPESDSDGLGDVYSKQCSVGSWNIVLHYCAAVQ